jgi:hypothetical protein
MAGNSKRRPEIWQDILLADEKYGRPLKYRIGNMARYEIRGPEHAPGYSIREQENTEATQLED